MRFIELLECKWQSFARLRECLVYVSGLFFTGAGAADHPLAPIEVKTKSKF